MTKIAWTINAKSETEAEVLLYDDIGKYWGKSAKDFVKEIKELGDVTSITLRINSAGGSVFEAQAMYNYLRLHKAHKTVRIDGLAASAASVLAMVGDKIIMPSNALMMIHNPWTFAWGESTDMRKVAEVLDKVRDTLAAVYVARTGLEYEKIKAMMDEETWMSADEALSMGFCDETDEAIEIAACAPSLSEGDVTWRTGAGEAQFSRKLAEKMPAAAQKMRLSLTNQAPQTPIKNAKNNESIKPKEEPVLNIKTLAELEAAYPQLAADLKNAGMEAGVKAERERLKALDSLAGDGRDAIIAQAKYEEPKDARDIAMELLQATKNVEALQDRKNDASDINNVLPFGNLKPTVQEQEDEAADKVAGAINKQRGYSS